MLKRIISAGQHAAAILAALPVAAKRTLLWQMVALSRTLPQQFERPLPAMLAQLTPPARAEPPVQPDEIRRLADAVAAWHWRSPLGICLRRSLLRYHFLRGANLPVRVVFGARLKTGQAGGGIGGHAWLTLNGAPYYENPGDYEGFVAMYTYPDK